MSNRMNLFGEPDDDNESPRSRKRISKNGSDQYDETTHDRPVQKSINRQMKSLNCFDDVHETHTERRPLDKPKPSSMQRLNLFGDDNEETEIDNQEKVRKSVRTNTIPFTPKSDRPQQINSRESQKSPRPKSILEDSSIKDYIVPFTHKLIVGGLAVVGRQGNVLKVQLQGCTTGYKLLGYTDKSELIFKLEPLGENSYEIPPGILSGGELFLDDKEVYIRLPGGQLYPNRIFTMAIDKAFYDVQLYSRNTDKIKVGKYRVNTCDIKLFTLAQ